MVAEEKRTVKSRAFSAYECPFEMVTSFRYLGRVISVADDDWKSVVPNMAKARTACRSMRRILSREGVRLRVYRFFFKSIV